MHRKRLPIGVQSFRDLRETDCYYVDKTPLIAQMVERGSHYFLSRPRRFGKSLLVDTLRELFSCNEPLFRGLHIHGRWDWNDPRPVVRLSFAADYNEPGALAANVHTQLTIIEDDAGVEPAAPGSRGPDRLLRLLHRLHRETGKRVAVLVDEYDKPILDVLEHPDLARANRDYLRGLYGVLKGAAEHVRFVLVTGVSMFSKASLFSGLNNLENISLDPAFATICGYAETDLDTVFAPELEGFDRDEIRRWYNGYGWRGSERVYNPHDVLLLFRTREFDPHWFGTATPTFLFRLMMERGVSPMDLEGCEVDRASLTAFDVEAIETSALLFQSGYLTIGGEERRSGETLFRLDYPNREVRLGLNRALLRHVSGLPRAVSKQTWELGDMLARNDFVRVQAILRAFFASVPYQWSATADLARYEAWYAGMLFACFRSIGLELRAEESTAQGRSDLVVLHSGRVFVIECKVARKCENAAAAVARAMSQMRARGYAEPSAGEREGEPLARREKYLADGVPVRLVAMAFGRAERNLVAVHVEAA